MSTMHRPFSSETHWINKCNKGRKQTGYSAIASPSGISAALLLGAWTAPKLLLVERLKLWTLGLTTLWRTIGLKHGESAWAGAQNCLARSLPYKDHARTLWGGQEKIHGILSRPHCSGVCHRKPCDSSLHHGGVEDEMSSAVWVPSFEGSYLPLCRGFWKKQKVVKVVKGPNQHPS